MRPWLHDPGLRCRGARGTSGNHLDMVVLTLLDTSAELFQNAWKLLRSHVCTRLATYCSAGQLHHELQLAWNAWHQTTSKLEETKDRQKLAETDTDRQRPFGRAETDRDSHRPQRQTDTCAGVDRQKQSEAATVAFHGCRPTLRGSQRLGCVAIPGLLLTSV